MSRQTWEEIARRFDPDTPPEPQWRATRDLSPVPEIEAALDVPAAFGSPHVLLTGTTGTGKTTELLRVAERRAARGKEFVLYIDLDRHFNETVGDSEALAHIASWEVCFLVGIALIRAAEDRLGDQFPADQLKELQESWHALARATETPAPGPQIDVGALAKSVTLVVSAAVSPSAPAAVAGLTLLQGLASAVKWSMGRSKKSASDQDIPAQTLLSCVNRMLATFRQRAVSVLVIVDGLDRITEIDQAEKLFVESEMVGRLDCPLVVCGPFVLRNHMATALARRFSEKLTLANVPVLLHQDPRRHGPGVSFLCELWRKRIAGLHAEGSVDASDLERLAYYSGGRIRDFVRTVRMLAGEAWTADAPKATGEMVDRVLRKARLLMEQGLDRGHIDELDAVVRDPKHLLPKNDAARDLLKYGRLLPYSNGSEWFYPHPLLTMSLVSAEPPGSAP